MHIQEEQKRSRHFITSLFSRARAYELSIPLASALAAGGIWIFMEIAEEVFEGETRRFDEAILVALCLAVFGYLLLQKKRGMALFMTAAGYTWGRIGLSQLLREVIVEVGGMVVMLTGLYLGLRIACSRNSRLRWWGHRSDWSGAGHRFPQHHREFSCQSLTSRHSRDQDGNLPAKRSRGNQ